MPKIINEIKYEPKKSLSEQKFDVILAHILNPEDSPIPEEYKEQFNRVISAARLLDDFHPASVIPRLLAKYNISQNTARRDIILAQELFKSNHRFDWDYWVAWQIKDLVETIKTCKLLGKHKESIAAHKALKLVIGEKVAMEEDPKRMEKNVFYIQLNNNGTIVNMDLNKIKGLDKSEIRTVVEALTSNVETDEQIAEILNT